MAYISDECCMQKKRTHRDEDAYLAPAVHGRLWHHEADTANSDGTINEDLVWTLSASRDIP